MAHGYLGDGYGIDRDIDPDAGERRDRDERRRGEDRDHGFMFEGRDRDRFRDRGDSGASEWFGGRDRYQRQGGFRSLQDDHYRSWRDRQIDALDRDYADYCREREQQFHQDFDSWRSNRRRHGEQRASSPGSEDELVLAAEHHRPGEGPAADATAEALGAATLGTNNSENTAPGRR